MNAIAYWWGWQMMPMDMRISARQCASAEIRNRATLIAGIRLEQYRQEWEARMHLYHRKVREKRRCRQTGP